MTNPSFIVELTADEYYRGIMQSLLNTYHTITGFSPPYHLNELPEPLQSKFRTAYAIYYVAEKAMNELHEEIFETYRNGKNSV